MVASKHITSVNSLKEFDRALEAVGEAPILVSRNGAQYLISRMDENEQDLDFWAGYDPDLARQALHEAIGLFDDIDIDRWIADIYERRRLGSRPPDRSSWREKT